MIGRAGTAGGYEDTLVLQGVEQNLRADTAHTHTQDMRSRCLICSSVENNIGDDTEALDQAVFHGEQFCPVTVEVFIEHPGGKRHTGDAGNIFCAGPQAVLLSSAVHLRYQPHAVCNIEKSGSLGTMDLVSADRQKVNIHPFGINLCLAEALHCIDMKERIRICGFDGLSDLFDRLHCADNIIRMHNRHQDRVRTDSCRDLFRGDQAVPVNTQPGDLKSLCLQIFHGLQNCRVLDQACDQMFSLPLRSHGRADDRKVVRLRSAGCEAKILFLRLQDPGQDLFRFRNAPFRSDAPVVHGGRIAVILEKELIHQSCHFRKAPGRRGIIEVDISFFIHKSVLVSVAQGCFLSFLSCSVHKDQSSSN